MLYTWRQDEDVFVKYPELLTIPEFAKLTERQFKVTALTADIKSPLRTLPDKQKRTQAALSVLWPMEGERVDKNGRNFVAKQVPTIEAAIVKYKELQYDENREALDTVQNQIQDIVDYLKTDKSVPTLYKGKIILDEKGKEVRTTDPKVLETATKLIEKLPMLVETKKKLQSLFEYKEEKVELPTTFTSADIPESAEEDDTPMSTLDKYMQSQK